MTTRIIKAIEATKIPTIEEVEACAEVLAQWTVMSNPASQVLAINETHFRSLLRKGDGQLNLLTVLRLYNHDIFYSPQLDEVKAARLVIKEAKAANKAVNLNGRVVDPLNRNVLQVAGSMLGLTALTKLTKVELKDAVKKVVDTHYSDVDWDNLSTPEFLNLVTSIDVDTTTPDPAADVVEVDVDALLAEEGS